MHSNGVLLSRYRGKTIPVEVFAWNFPPLVRPLGHQPETLPSHVQFGREHPPGPGCPEGQGATRNVEASNRYIRYRRLQCAVLSYQSVTSFLDRRLWKVAVASEWTKAVYLYIYIYIILLYIYIYIYILVCMRS